MSVLKINLLHFHQVAPVKAFQYMRQAEDCSPKCDIPVHPTHAQLDSDLRIALAKEDKIISIGSLY